MNLSYSRLRLAEQARPCKRFFACRSARRLQPTRFAKSSRALRPVAQARNGILGRLAAAGQARIGHEVGRAVEAFLVRTRNDARGRTVAEQLPALLIVLQIGD